MGFASHQRLVAVMAAALALALAAAGCEGRPRQAPEPAAPETQVSRHEPHLAIVDLRAGAPEQSGSSWLGGAAQHSFARLVLTLRELRTSEYARGVLVKVGTGQLSLAQAEETGRRLRELGQRGLPIVCHADELGNATMLLAASGCQEIWLSPSGSVETVGIAAQLVFARSLLRKLYVEADFVQAGKYKGAEEPFTRDSASPEARETLRSTLAAMRTAWLETLAAGRNAEAAALGLEDGPYPPEDAAALGLIDRVGYAQDVEAELRDRLGVEGSATYFGDGPPEEASIAEVVRILSGARSHSAPYVAVVRATGSISMAGSSPFGSDGITARGLTRVLRRLGEDAEAAAVVLRIDSPGGSALASDLLWKELMALREHKPIVASLGAMAASGGMYLASGATEIVAERTTIVGSIGVVSGKFSFGQSLAEIGVQVETVEAAEGTGDRALYASALAPWDDATRQRVRESVDSIYELFVARVAEGRQTSPATIAQAAEGRLFAGQDAIAMGLADRIGGLGEAIDRALDLASLPRDTDVEIVETASGLLALLSPDGEARAGAAADLERRAARASQATLFAGLEPVRAELDAFLASTAPLLQGERVLAALPYILAVR